MFVLAFRDCSDIFLNALLEVGKIMVMSDDINFQSQPTQQPVFSTVQARRASEPSAVMHERAY